MSSQEHECHGLAPTAFQIFRGALMSLETATAIAVINKAVL